MAGTKYNGIQELGSEGFRGNFNKPLIYNPVIDIFGVSSTKKRNL